MKKINDMSSPAKTPTFGSIFLKASLLSLLFATIMLFITALGVGIWGFSKLNNFAKLAGTSIPELKEVFMSGVNTPAIQFNSKKNFLLLGVDSLETRPGSPALTDTIILISLDLKSGTISTISLPRDLWSDEYLTRINALYFYGQEKYPENPEKFTKEVIQDLTGVNINHTIVISMDSVAEAINILGGIEVNVEESFADTNFPNPDVDVTKTTDPKKLYQTISFEKGTQLMDGERVLQFIRSRKSNDDEGNDLARSKRQQIVIGSTVQKLKNLSLLRDEETIAKLYKYYQENFSKQFPIQEGIATIKSILPIIDKISFNTNSINIYPENKLGAVTNPPTYKYNGEWVYEITNKEVFQKEIKDKLGL